MVPWAGQRCVIVVFSDHTHLLFNSIVYSFEIAIMNLFTGIAHLHTLHNW